jgi:proton-translocating NADH-quinone oxidoreductase chain M
MGYFFFFVGIFSIFFFFDFLKLINQQNLKVLSFLFFFINFLLVLFFWANFDSLFSNYQFVYTFGFLKFFNINFTFGIDAISLIFLFLTALIFPICLFFNWELLNTISGKFLIYLLVFLEIFLFLTFTVMDLFLFYIFFEVLLIPMFFLICFWGSRLRKLKAGFFFFFYTLFGSILLLFAIIFIFLNVGGTSIFLLYNVVFDIKTQFFLWICFFISFAVKMPLFPFHLWLPEAHVEAPTTGSVILASILLKLGGYGFIKFLLPVLPEACFFFYPLVVIIGLLGVFYASLTACRQTDIKRIIAYSSVAHMSFVILGLISFNFPGFLGSLLLMFGHGLISALFFILVGFLYERFSTRYVFYFVGLFSVMPIYSFFFFFATISNISFPGTINFISEFLIFFSVFSHTKNIFLLVLSALGFIVTLFYSFLLVNRILFNIPNTHYLLFFYDLTKLEVFFIIPLIFWIVFLGIFPNFVFCLFTQCFPYFYF